MGEREKFMEIAIDEARRAPWPFGAVLVIDGKEIARAGSGDGESNETDPTAHAEVNVIRKACLKMNVHDFKNKNAILYASCEPCAMCFGAAWYAGIKQIVFGSSLSEMREVGKSWGGDLAFPKDKYYSTNILIEGGLMKDKVMKVYEDFNSRIL